MQKASSNTTPAKRSTFGLTIWGAGRAAERKTYGSVFEPNGELVLCAGQGKPDALLSGQERPARKFFQDGREFFI
jgi:hypothetical protein